jgi:glycosyltransferase involved in cell wall biosynthesis
MRILLINYRYFVSGGPERYLFNLKALLEVHGHETIPFSIKYDQNEPCDYSEYFVTPLSKADEVFFRDQTWTLGSIQKTLARTFYSREVYRALKALIDYARPDCAIVLHYLKKLSPSVLTALEDARVPYVVRLSDFGMVCPNAHLFRGQNVCELCVKGSKLQSVQYRCVQGSFAASAINYVATTLHNALHLFDRIPLFVVPSQFTLEKMIEGGIGASRLVHVPTMVDVPSTSLETRRDNQMLFSGRIAPLKGIEVLLKAIAILFERDPRFSLKLHVAGMGDEKYTDRLRQEVLGEVGSRIEFLGKLSLDALNSEIYRSASTICPSLWYDNMPNAALESLARSTPVIAPRHGSFPEIVQDKETGLLFDPGNAEDLAEKIKWVISHPQETQTLGNAGSAFVRKHHSPSLHYERMMEALTAVLEKRKGERAH